MPRRWWLRTDFDENLKKNPNSTLRILMYSMALCVAYADFRMGYEYGFALFYLLPIILATRNLGKEAGILTSVFSTALWLYTESIAHHSYSYPFVLYWNGAIRFVFFLIAVMIFDGWEKEKAVARLDELTMVANRRAFNEFGEMEIRRCRRYDRPFSLIYIDMDNFKTINDRYGHREGDRLLVRVAETLQRNFRETDVVARLGGDEFAVILLETPAEGAQKALDRVYDQLMAIPNVGSAVTMSIGLATFNKAPELFEEAVRRADELMYKAKSKGKNRVEIAVFSASPAPA